MTRLNVPQNSTFQRPDSSLDFSSDSSSESARSLVAALKEWAIALEALLSGDTILLLRKGGIRETGGRFSVAQSRVLLYPTYEHQQPHLLKPPYADRVQPVPSGWHPDTVTLCAWADITHIFQITTAETVEALLPFHIWTNALATERLKWKPQQPLYVLLLRVHRFPESFTLPYQGAYGGCKSWIDVELPAGYVDNPFADAPVLTQEQYDSRVKEIERVVLGQ
ncbi:MAG TPA: DUF1802 family protein [Thermoleptolyngbya sp. M55_K2018_002]|nr:DUF1802 family protein [Thermoleptolyngbya sp. M55_K2018_002]